MNSRLEQFVYDVEVRLTALPPDATVGGPHGNAS